MQTFTVHLPDAARRDAAMLERAEFVPDGFRYGAFAFGGFWLAAHRLWIALALYLVTLALVVAAGMVLQLDPGLGLTLVFLLHLLLGLEGNQIRRLSLEKSGRPSVGVVAAGSLQEAEAKFFTEAMRQQAAPPAGASLPPRAQPGPVLGVFPQPGGRA